MPEALSLPLEWGTLRAWHWPAPGAPRVLCLHGWMDNAASFAPLAPLLTGLDLVALEFAGHGHSDHRPVGCQYHFSDYLFDLDAALDRLGWDRCALVGHSLGGGVASSYAAAAPARVERLVLLDAVGVLSEEADRAAARLARSIATVREPRQHRRRYRDIGQAAQVRRANNPMSLDAAELLVARALEQDGDAWRWRTDARLLWTSPLLPTEAQARDLLGAVRCPVLALTMPTSDEWLGAEALAGRLACLDAVSHVRLEGGHHLHLDAPETVAAHILPFLSPGRPAP